MRPHLQCAFPEEASQIPQAGAVLKLISHSVLGLAIVSP